MSHHIVHAAIAVAPIGWKGEAANTSRALRLSYRALDAIGRAPDARCARHPVPLHTLTCVRACVHAVLVLPVLGPIGDEG